MECPSCNGVGYYEITCPDCNDDPGEEYWSEFCQTCNCTGYAEQTCEQCDGSGQIEEEE
jgi:DnaJ-class molecular chaperone